MTSQNETLHSLLKDFNVAMFITRAQSGELRARPMAVADVQDDGTIWLLTDRHSGKIEEIAFDHHVNITMQSSSKFVSVSGIALTVDDRQRIAELWNEAWKVWFPGGKDDPSLVLIEVHGDTGEYWDNSGFNSVKYLFEASKAYLKGTRPDVGNDQKIHGKVNL